MTLRTTDGAVRKILMTVDAVGGVWRYALDLAAGLEEKNVDVILAGFGPPPSNDHIQEVPHNCRLVWLDAPLDWMVDDPDRLAQVPGMIEEVALRERVDVLHLNLPSQAAWLRPEKPVVVMSHSCIPTWFSAVRGTPPPPDWRFHEKLGRQGLSRADLVLVPSKSHGESLKAAYGDLPRLKVVYNSSDVFSPPAQKDDFVLGAGRWWDEGKNGAILDQAARNAIWPVVMAGSVSGPNGQRLDIANCRSKGECAHRDVMSLMRAAAIFVSPSIYEPFGLAALEAARCGCALVLADIATYRELWDGAALFASPRDPGAFSTAINRLARDRVLRERLGTKAMSRSLDFTLRAQVDAMLHLYRAAMHLPRFLTAAE